MIEKGKSVLLFLLVVISLYQSYLLAYSKPFMVAKVKTELDYVNAEPLGNKEKVEQLVFPEQLVLHLGNDKHTVFYPNTKPYYDLILDLLVGRNFKSLQRDSVHSVDWDRIRSDDKGVELRFGRAIPFELLQKVFKIDGDFLFYRDTVDRIWIYTSKGRDEVRTFFFSSDGRNVYEAQKADLTVSDVEGYVGFGQYWDPYGSYGGEGSFPGERGQALYVPEKPVTRLLEMEVPFDKYSTEQMQDNLFFDPGSTTAIPNSDSGQQFYTDWKRALKIEQSGTWLTYTDQVAPTEGDNELVENVMAAVNFVNQHGGWNGKHAYVRETETEAGSTVVRFQQYYGDVPIVSDGSLNMGYMQMTLQHGLVASYARSLVSLDEIPKNKRLRKLPGGEDLRALMKAAEKDGDLIESLFPAYRPRLNEETILLTPVWAARMTSGAIKIVAESVPAPAGSP